MRRLFTMEDALTNGLTRSAIRWGEQNGRWRRVDKGVWAEGPDDVTTFDRARAAVLASGAVASHHLAGVLHGLDSVRLDGVWMTVPPTASGARSHIARRLLPEDRVVQVAGLRCTDAGRTLVDLAASLPEPVWEQALESALRRRLASIDDLAAAAAGRGRAASLVRRVLSVRPAGAPPTESLLETLMVQLIRTVPGLPEPVRQLWIEAAHARLDLAWPALGLFVELDGEHHKGQPVYDASRETAVVAASGWLCGRFTWTQVVRTPASTARRLDALADQARRRPVAFSL